MPYVTALNQVFGILNNLPLPGSGGSNLNAVIRPPVETDQTLPMAYIFITDGDEHRQSVPRPLLGTPGTGSTQAGWKDKDHTVTIWLRWFQDDGDPTPDQSFYVILDAVEDALRCTEDPVLVQDPVTYRYSQLYAIGEVLRGRIEVPHYTADQRMFQWDAEITCTVKEEFQA